LFPIVLLLAMSGLSFSTHTSPTLTGRATERHLTHAKRRLYQFVLKEIDGASKGASTASVDSHPDESDLLFISLPIEVLHKVMCVMDPFGK
jgi:hypothetical protein